MQLKVHNRHRSSGCRFNCTEQAHLLSTTLDYKIQLRKVNNPMEYPRT